MPTYEYRCEKCKKEFELSQKISEPSLSKCPDCSGKVTRLVSAAAFSLKGGGWYKDGYAKQKQKKEEKKNEPQRHQDTKKNRS